MPQQAVKKLSSGETQTITKKMGLAEEIEQLHSDFIQFENDTRYDSQGNPIASYTMPAWDKLTGRLEKLVLKAKKQREENKELAQQFKKARTGLVDGFAEERQVKFNHGLAILNRAIKALDEESAEEKKA